MLQPNDPDRTGRFRAVCTRRRSGSKEPGSKLLGNVGRSTHVQMLQVHAARRRAPLLTTKVTKFRPSCELSIARQGKGGPARPTAVFDTSEKPAGDDERAPTVAIAAATTLATSPTGG